MQTYQQDVLSDKKSGWLVFRLDTQVQDQPVDIYFIMDLPSGMIIAQEIVEAELSQAQAESLFKQGKQKVNKVPTGFILAKNDPAETVIRPLTEKLGIHFELVPAFYLEEWIAPIKQLFGKEFFSPSSIGYQDAYDHDDQSDRESIKAMIPDSYDPCPCASGKKYKFCCKRIFREVMEAMVAAENGNFSEALKWINKAKSLVGETAEVLCREAIIYGYFDTQKSEALLNQCLAINPKHPRAHYIRGITLKEQGDFQGAINAYRIAINHYPPSDHFHLNETYNNLGTAFYGMGDKVNAKIAWEKALLHMPSDKMARMNLSEFIYNKTFL